MGQFEREEAAVSRATGRFAAILARRRARGGKFDGRFDQRNCLAVMALLIKIALGLAAVYAAIALLLFVSQTRLIFPLTT